MLFRSGLFVSARCSAEMDSIESSELNAASFLRSSTSAVLEKPSRGSGTVVCDSHKKANVIRNDAEYRGMLAMTGHRSTSPRAHACSNLQPAKIVSDNSGTGSGSTENETGRSWLGISLGCRDKSIFPLMNPPSSITIPAEWTSPINLAPFRM